jgi:hypothetical protein
MCSSRLIQSAVRVPDKGGCGGSCGSALSVRLFMQKPAADLSARAEPKFPMMPFCRCFARRVKRTKPHGDEGTLDMPTKPADLSRDD